MTDRFRQQPRMVGRLVRLPGIELAARVLLTFVFWTSGLAKLVDFNASAVLMEDFGLAPGWAVNALVLALQLGASLMIILDRGTWLAAGALASFTVLTVPIAHPFWTMSGEAAFRDLTVALEHVSVVGGLAMVAILSGRRAAGSARGREPSDLAASTKGQAVTP